MHSYVLAEFDMKNVQIEEGDGALKQWSLADNKNSEKKKNWCVQLLAWNNEARKFTRQLPIGTRVLISNFLVKDRFRKDDSSNGQSPYKIHFTYRTTLTAIG